MALLCWSGGFDSTLALYQLAQKNEPNLRTISFVQQQLAARNLEKQARQGIQKWFRQHSTQHFDCLEVKIVESKDVGSARVGDQAGMWLLHAMPYLEKGETLFCGYIRGDDFWHYAAHYWRAFEEMRIVLGNPDAHLDFPLEWTTKREVMKGLPGSLRSLCFSCQNPKEGKPCGECTSCQNRRLALVAR